MEDFCLEKPEKWYWNDSLCYEFNYEFKSYKLNINK